MTGATQGEPQAVPPAPPRVSIIIAAYNSERYLPQTLLSIQAQTLPDWECIIVDDGSKDCTLRAAAGFAAADPRIRVVTQPNAGPAAARNRGLSLIHPASRYITFMDADDLWVSAALRMLVDEVESHPDAVGAHGYGCCIGQDGEPFDDSDYTAHGCGRVVFDSLGRRVPLDSSRETSFESLWFSNPFPPGLILARRSGYEKTGPFDLDLCPVEDWDILIRLCRHGGLRFVNRRILSYRRHPSNLSAASGTDMVEKIRMLFYKTYYSPDNTPAHLQIVRRNWRSSQVAHFRAKMAKAGEHISSGRIGAAARAFAGMAADMLRFAHGRPSRGGLIS